MTKLEQLLGAIDRTEANARKDTAVVGLVTYRRPDGSLSGPTAATCVDGQWICDGRVVEELAGFRVLYDPQRTLGRCAADRKLLDIAFENAAKVDAEYGCCHGPDDIRNGLCPDQQPDRLDIVTALFEAHSLTDYSDA